MSRLYLYSFLGSFAATIIWPSQNKKDCYKSGLATAHATVIARYFFVCFFHFQTINYCIIRNGNCQWQICEFYDRQLEVFLYYFCEKDKKRAQIFLDLHPFTMLFRRCARFVYGEIKE